MRHYVYSLYISLTILSDFRKMNNLNIENIMTSAQIATALVIIAAVVAVTLLHSQLHRHK